MAAKMRLYAEITRGAMYLSLREGTRWSTFSCCGSATRSTADWKLAEQGYRRITDWDQSDMAEIVVYKTTTVSL